MSTIINGTSSAITFPDSTVQNTAFTTGAVTQSTIATGVAGTGPAFSAKGTAVSTTNATVTKLTATTITFDTNTNFASSRFTPTVAGYYQINITVTSAGSATGFLQGVIYKNGANYFGGSAVANATFGPVVNTSSVVYCNGSTDYIEIYGYQTSGGALTMTINDFSGSLVRSA